MKKVFIALCFVSSLFAQTPGILGKKAPELGKLNWTDSKGKKIDPINLKDHRGKVVYLHFFQSWCPGCLSSGLPSIKSLSDKYANNSDIKFYAIQTVFEGFGVNTARKVHSIRKRFQLNIPMAHDDGKSQGLKRSALISKYRSGGTPWTIIIDKKGRVVFNNFHLPINQGQKVINKLLKL